MIVAIVQARMQSERLPGKSLELIAGRPMLWHVVQRARSARRVQRVVVATTSAKQDNVIAAHCAGWGVGCFRGDERDVLDRMARAAIGVQATRVARITADCPLLDPGLIDQVIESCVDGGFDYASNTLEPTWPDGLDVEAMSTAALLKAAREARSPAEREHVTLYITRHPERFRLCSVCGSQDLSHMRWTVDEPADLAFVRAIYERLGTHRFDYTSVLRLLEREPDLLEQMPCTPRNEGLRRSLAAEQSVSRPQAARR